MKTTISCSIDFENHNPEFWTELACTATGKAIAAKFESMSDDVTLTAHQVKFCMSRRTWKHADAPSYAPTPIIIVGGLR